MMCVSIGIAFNTIMWQLLVCFFLMLLTEHCESALKCVPEAAGREKFQYPKTSIIFLKLTRALLISLD